MSVEWLPVHIQSPTLNLVEAGHVITDALNVVNKEENAIKIVYIGQPMGAVEQSDGNLKIIPQKLLDLAM